MKTPQKRRLIFQSVIWGDIQIKQSISVVGGERVTTEPVAVIQTINRGDLFVGQFEVEHVEVLGDS